MARYVDGFVLPVPKKNVQAYRRLAQGAAKVWREHGALEYRECVGDDLKPKGAVPFPRLARCKPGRPWSSPGSSTNREPIAIGSTPR